MSVHRIGHAIVHGGQVVVSGLPLHDGERVQVIVTDMPDEQRRTIVDVRQLLRGSVERYDDPFEPVVPTDSWEMLK